MMRHIRFFLIRHGLTAWNQSGRIQGREDIPLSMEGSMQAALLSSYLQSKQDDFLVEKIYTSPLLRAKNTADQIAVKLDVPVVKDEDLVEIDFGEISGVRWKEMSEEHSSILRYKSVDPFSISYPQGEEHTDTVERAKRFIERVIEEDGKSIIVLSHTAMLRVITGLILNKTYQQMLKIPFSNCAITEISAQFDIKEFNSKGVLAFQSRVVMQNYNHYLKTERTFYKALIDN